MKLKIIFQLRLEKELISKNLIKYIASLDYFDNHYMFYLYYQVVFLLHHLQVLFLKTRNNMKKHNKIIMLARSKLNSIESKISKALMDNEISHEDFETIINEEKKYRELKESIRMMNSHRSDAEKVSLIEEGKKIGINEVIRHNEIINNTLK